MGDADGIARRHADPLPARSTDMDENSDVAKTPPELFLASLGARVGYYVTQYCDARHMDCENLKIQVDGEFGPTLAAWISCEMDEERLEILHRAAP